MANTKDITQIAISSDASNVVDNLMGSNLFKDRVDVLTFAAGYMIKNHFNDFDPYTYSSLDSLGSNFSSGTFDPDRKWYYLIKALYNNTEIPYTILKALMDKGLLILGQDLGNNPSLKIASFL